MRSTWKKAIAAVAALPMMVTLLSATTALADESTGADAAAQQALNSAMQQNAADNGANSLLASFDFNDLKNGATGEIADVTGNAKAAINGASAAVSNPGNGTTAAKLGSGFWLNVTKTDGTPLLKGRNSITLTYDSKATQGNQGWSFYAAPNADAPTYRSERYIGVMDQTASVTMQKYNNDGNSRNNSGNVTASTGADWKHVSIVITDDASTLYIDGKQQATAKPDAGRTLTDILGVEGGILQIGKANWGNGEYFSGSLDNLKIYGSALDQTAITKDYEDSQVQASDEEKLQADLDALFVNNGQKDVYSSITLPDTGSVNGSTVTWSANPAGVITTEAKDGKAAGVVTRQKADTKVMLTAALKQGNSVETKKFELNVKAAVAQPKTTDYVFAHFTGTEGSSTDEQIYFATSEDGLTWHDTRDSGDPVLTWNKSQTGNSRGKDNGVRDPYLVRSPEGDTVYLIATELSIHNRGGWGSAAATSTGSPNLIVWETHDMVSWSEPRAVDVASKIPGAGMAWAPEAYWDDANQQYMVYWATASDADNESGDRTNMYYSTTRDFVNFTAPVKWIDRSKSVIDTTMIKADDGYYYRVSGDTYLGVERSKNPYAITLTTGSTIADGYYNTSGDENQWTYVGQFKDLVGNDKWTGSKLEGPELFQYNADDMLNKNGKEMKYGLMWDQYSEGKGYLPFYSANLGSTDKADWAQATDVNFGLLKKRHGTILPITSTERKAMLKAFDKNRVTEPVAPDKAGSDPIAQYTFDDADNPGKDSKGKYDLTLKGKAVQADDAAKGKVLKLDGGSTTSEAYAEFPKGMFDGRNKLTVQMDVKSEINANHFTFTFGKDTNKYYFLKYNNSGELGSRITTASYGAEDAANATLAGSGAWHKVTVVLDDNTMTVYSDGTKVAENTSTNNKVTDLGTDLLAYLGKSFYNDPYFKGSYDNVTIWNRALTADEVAQASPVALQDIVAGTVPAAGSEANALKGTDGHTLVRTSKDDATKTVTTVLNQRADVAKTPVKLTFNRGAAEAKVTVDGKAVEPAVSADGTTATITVDLTADRKVGVSYGEDSTVWTLKAATVSNNPVLPGQYADPDIDYFPETGKFWIYPTTDGFSGWSGNYFHAWSSTDLVHWEDEGVILDVNAANKPADGQQADPANYGGSKVDNIAFSPWSTGSAWAPTIEAKDTNNDGKMEYFFYYCAKKSNGTSYIGVAKADNPAGPFVPASDALVSPTMEGVKVGQAIDPSVFTDDDGKSYILYGNGSAAIAELDDDMMSIKSGTVRKLSGLKDFRESVVVMKHGGKYHWTWSCDDAGSENYHVNYGVSDSLDGTITVKTEWLVGKDKANGIQGTAHQSDVTVTDGTGRERTFMAYHRHYTPLGVFASGLGYHRETAISEVTFDKDGYMQKVDVTKNIESVQMAKTDYTKLEEVVKEAKALDETDYTAESWKVFQDSGKLESAEKVLETKNAKYAAYQAEVDAAVNDLTAVMGGLVKNEPVTPPSSVDKSQLQTAVDAAKPESDASKYTAESWKTYRDALTAAEAVLANESATQEQVDAALESLKTAESGLKTAGSGESTNQPNNSGDTNKPNTGASGDNSGNKTGTSDGGKSTIVAATGSVIAAVAAAGVVLAAAGIALVAYRRRFRAENR